MVALWQGNGKLLQEWLCHTLLCLQVCCSQSPCPHGRPLLTHASAGDTQRHGSAVAMSLGGLWALVHARFCLSPPSVFDGYGFDSKLHLTFPTILLGLLVCLWMWGIFFLCVGFNILLSMVIQQRVAILELLQEKMSTCPSTLPSNC